MTRYHLTEMQELACRFSELAQALSPAPGEVDTMVVPISVMKRLLEFSASNLSRLQKAAEFLPDEALAEVLGVVASGGEGNVPPAAPGTFTLTRESAPRAQASDGEWFLP